MARRALQHRRKAFRNLDAVIDREAVHRQHVLDRRLVVARATIDALEAIIAAEHQKSAAGAHKVAQQTQAVWRLFECTQVSGCSSSVLAPMSESTTAS